MGALDRPAPPAFGKDNYVPDNSANIVSKILFNWLTPILVVGWSRSLQKDGQSPFSILYSLFNNPYHNPSLTSSHTIVLTTDMDAPFPSCLTI